MLEIINERFYDILAKVDDIKDQKTADTFRDILDLIALVMERQNSANKHFDTNIMGLAGDMSNFHKDIITLQNNNSCCSQPNQSQQKNNQQPTNEIMDIADFIMSDNRDYNEYINNKRKETIKFVEKVNDVEDTNKLSANIGTLSNFIESKLRK